MKIPKENFLYSWDRSPICFDQKLLDPSFTNIIEAASRSDVGLTTKPIAHQSVKLYNCVFCPFDNFFKHIYACLHSTL